LPSGGVRLVAVYDKHDSSPNGAKRWNCGAPRSQPLRKAKRSTSCRSSGRRTNERGRAAGQRFRFFVRYAFLFCWTSNVTFGLLSLSGVECVTAPEPGGNHQRAVAPDPACLHMPDSQRFHNLSFCHAAPFRFRASRGLRRSVA